MKIKTNLWIFFKCFGCNTYILVLIESASLFDTNPISIHKKNFGGIKIQTILKKHRYSSYNIHINPPRYEIKIYTFWVFYYSITEVKKISADDYEPKQCKTVLLITQVVNV